MERRGSKRIREDKEKRVRRNVNRGEMRVTGRLTEEKEGREKKIQKRRDGKENKREKKRNQYSNSSCVLYFEVRKKI